MCIFYGTAMTEVKGTLTLVQEQSVFPPHLLWFMQSQANAGFWRNLQTVKWLNCRGVITGGAHKEQRSKGALTQMSTVVQGLALFLVQIPAGAFSLWSLHVLYVPTWVCSFLPQIYSTCHVLIGESKLLVNNQLIFNKWLKNIE